MSVMEKILESGSTAGRTSANVRKFKFALFGRNSSLFSPQWFNEKVLQGKIEAIAKKMYGAGSVTYSEEAEKDMERYNKLGFGGLPICMAKTQYSFSGEAEKKGVPTGFELVINRVSASVGAGFLVPLVGGSAEQRLMTLFPYLNLDKYLLFPTLCFANPCC